MSKQEITVYLSKRTITSGRGGYPSIGYRAQLVSVATLDVIAETKTVDGVNDAAWRVAGEQLAKRRGYKVVSDAEAKRIRAGIAYASVNPSKPGDACAACACGIGFGNGLGDAHTCRDEQPEPAPVKPEERPEAKIIISRHGGSNVGARIVAASGAVHHVGSTTRGSAIVFALGEAERLGYRVSNRAELDAEVQALAELRAPDTITRRCAGGCGSTIEYALDFDGNTATPVYTPVKSGVRYAAGHLCIACDLVVADALRNARTSEGK